jgi:hypothetical protein
MKRLHHFDETDDVTGGDRVTIRLVRRLGGRRAPVECAGKRRDDLGHGKLRKTADRIIA